MILFAFYIALIILTGYIANSRGHSGFLWGVISAIFPVIATLLSLVLAKKGDKKVEKAEV